MKIKAFLGSPYAVQIERLDEKTDLLLQLSAQPLKEAAGDKAETSHHGMQPEKSTGTQR